jgi:hypothetical protein
MSIYTVNRKDQGGARESGGSLLYDNNHDLVSNIFVTKNIKVNVNIKERDIYHKF